MKTGIAINTDRRTGRGQVSRALAAFTLLELLLVVAIIALLMSLVFPALHAGQTAARRVRCVSNLRQLGLAVQLYWDDHDGVAFRYRGAPTNGGDVFWFGWLERGVEGRRTFDPALGALYPYLNGRGVELCPSLAYHSTQFKLKARGAAYGYGYNLNLSAPTNLPPLSLSRVGDPARLVVFADAAQVNTFQPPATPSRPMLEEFYYLSATEPTTHFRHEHRANAVSADGHVEGVTAAPGSIDARMPKAFVGSLAQECLRIE